MFVSASIGCWFGKWIGRDDEFIPSIAIIPEILVFGGLAHFFWLCCLVTFIGDVPCDFLWRYESISTDADEFPVTNESRSSNCWPDWIVSDGNRLIRGRFPIEIPNFPPICHDGLKPRTHLWSSPGMLSHFVLHWGGNWHFACIFRQEVDSADAFLAGSFHSEYSGETRLFSFFFFVFHSRNTAAISSNSKM